MEELAFTQGRGLEASTACGAHLPEGPSRGRSLGERRGRQAASDDQMLRPHGFCRKLAISRGRKPRAGLAGGECQGLSSATSATRTPWASLLGRELPAQDGRGFGATTSRTGRGNVLLPAGACVTTCSVKTSLLEARQRQRPLISHGLELACHRTVTSDGPTPQGPRSSSCKLKAPRRAEGNQGSIRKEETVEVASTGLPARGPLAGPTARRQSPQNSSPGDRVVTCSLALLEALGRSS